MKDYFSLMHLITSVKYVCFIIHNANKYKVFKMRSYVCLLPGRKFFRRALLNDPLNKIFLKSITREHGFSLISIFAFAL